MFENNGQVECIFLLFLFQNCYVSFRKKINYKTHPHFLIRNVTLVLFIRRVL